MKAYCDNIGAIFMGKTTKQSTRTKHIDARYDFIREYVVDVMVKIVFMLSEGNDSDILTKNVTTRACK